MQFLIIALGIFLSTPLVFETASYYFSQFNFFVF